MTKGKHPSMLTGPKLTGVAIPRHSQRGSLRSNGVKRVERRTDPEPFVRSNPWCLGTQSPVVNETTRFVDDEKVQKCHCRDQNANKSTDKRPIHFWVCPYLCLCLCVCLCLPASRNRTKSTWELLAIWTTGRKYRLFDFQNTELYRHYVRFDCSIAHSKALGD